ncbi:amidohydrolase [Thalassotalea atypica]|uniref:amidohydrolase n=1 Tax=Thalassotalea atypica TaxID=2054316 RepID=UPI00257235D7|nr:amidohydrolase [Thalassotalea atypica]
MKHYLVLALAGFLITSQKADSKTTSADLILTNGAVYTVNEKQPWAQAVAVSKGEIVAVGTNQEILSLAGKGTKQQNLKGKMLLPGFIDSHAHPVMGGAYMRSLSLDSFATPEHWVKQLAEFSAQNPNERVLFGYGFLASAFGPQGPTSAMLDKVVTDRPVIIMDEGFHGAWANTKAMKILGVNQDTPDPVPEFSYYKRDEHGRPTGYLLEGTATAAIEKLEVITAESIALGTSDVIELMNRYGITSVFDAGALDVDSLQLEVLEKLTKQGKMTVRMVASHMIGKSEAAKDAIKIASHKRAVSKHEMYHINTLKIMNDGTIEGKTAAMFEDYQGEKGNKGVSVFSQEQMNALIEQASDANMDVHIHALGERAISETLNAIELIRNNPKHNQSTSRYAICHIQVMTDEDVKRFAKLNVVAQSTPLWASYDEYGKAFVSDDQFSRYFRFNSLKEAGVKMAFGSDFPASGAGTLGMSPLFNMEIGHTRQTPEQENAPIQPGIEERLDIASLIKGYTLDGAYQLHLEDQIGSIEVGKKADFVLLDQNLFAVDKYNIHKVKVLQTILAGNTVYSSGALNN